MGFYSVAACHSKSPRIHHAEQLLSRGFSDPWRVLEVPGYSGQRVLVNSKGPMAVSVAGAEFGVCGCTGLRSLRLLVVLSQTG